MRAKLHEAGSVNKRRTAAEDLRPPRPSEHVVSATQADRTILLDMRRGRYYSLDGVGGRIWEMLQDGRCAAEIEERLAGEYDAPRERIARDLDTLLDHLRGKGLVS